MNSICFTMWKKNSSSYPRNLPKITLIHEDIPPNWFEPLLRSERSWLREQRADKRRIVQRPLTTPRPAAARADVWLLVCLSVCRGDKRRACQERLPGRLAAGTRGRDFTEQLPKQQRAPAPCVEKSRSGCRSEQHQMFPESKESRIPGDSKQAERV